MLWTVEELVATAILGPEGRDATEYPRRGPVTYLRHLLPGVQNTTWLKHNALMLRQTSPKPQSFCNFASHSDLYSIRVACRREQEPHVRQRILRKNATRESRLRPGS